MEIDTNVKFVSQKISKIRWKPLSRQSIQKADTFATGSWDDEQNNKLCIWSLAGGNADDVIGRNGTTAPPAGDPTLLCSAYHTGDVTDLKYFNPDNLMAASSSGTVSMYRHDQHHQKLSVYQSWDKLHCYKTGSSCPCTSISVRDDMMVSVGEDGKICVVTLEQSNPVRVIENADSCTLHAVTFLKQFEVLTVNSIGRLKVWDLRQPEDTPTHSFHLVGQCVPLMCVDKHPNQPHIVATGGQHGMLYIWDMRHDRLPVSEHEGHTAEMWEVKFHPTSPDNLFSCSEDGSVWHWDANTASSTLAAPSAVSLSQHTRGSGNISLSSTLQLQEKPPTANQTNAWLASDAAKHRMDIKELSIPNSMSVNSIDIESNTLLCGSDNESIFTIRNLVIK